MVPRRNQRNSVQLHWPDKRCTNSSGTVKGQLWNIACPEEPLPTSKHTVIHLKITWYLTQVNLFSSDVLLQHVKQQITNLHLECLPHPRYSFDHAPCDYHVREPCKERSSVQMTRLIRPCLVGFRVSHKIFFFFSRNPSIDEMMADHHWTLLGLLKSDKEFSIVFAHFILIFLKMRLLFYSQTYIQWIY